jgi:hypothetical protein
MSIQHTPLDVAKLSPAAQKALGPGPGKMMASRGIAPLAPADQLAVLYQISIDSDATLAETAKKTAEGLPEKILVGALGDAALDPRVLDFWATLHAGKPAVFDVAVQNASIADQTVAKLAQKADSRAVDMIATNEQRLLRHPEIIAAMYMNRRARMSTVDRVVELAVRNNVRVPNLACWDEIARSLVGGAGASDDDKFAGAVAAFSGDDSKLTAGDAEQVVPEDAANQAEDEEGREWEDLTIPQKIRVAQLGNAFARAKAIRDPVKIVSAAAIKSPGVTDMEAAKYASNQSLSDDVIRYIAQNRSWTRLYGVKVSLCRNPKTPIAEATRMLPFLRERDLTNLSKSKGVPSALVAQCRKLLMQRSGGKNK